MRYRKRPVIVDAIRFIGKNVDEIKNFVGMDMFLVANEVNIGINTLDGMMTAQPGDWIVRGTHGEFYPVKHSVFLETYEEWDK